MNIKCNSITKAYGKGNYGVKELSLEIKSGEFLVVMGESGCGKSTFLRLLSGIYYPDAGELFLDGVPANNIPPQQRDCAMIFQDYSLYPNMTVYDNIAYYLKKQMGLKSEQVDKRVMPIIEFMGLKNYVNVKPKFLSGGQQQRVCLAKALVRRPKLILFDEPLSNVDEKARDNYLRLIKETKKLLPNSTFVYVTHKSHEAKYLADRIAIMLDGAIVDVDTVEEIVKHPQYVDTTYLLGEGEIYRGDITDKFISQSPTGKIVKELGEFERETLLGENLSNVYYSPDIFLRGYASIFNEQGKIVSGYKKEALLPANISNFVIDFQGQKIELTDLQKQRFIGRDGFVNLKINTEKLHKNKTYNDFSITFTFYKNAFDLTMFKVEDRVICLKGEYKQDLVLYYNIEDIFLADTVGDNVLCRYAVYPNICNGKVKNGRLYIGKSTFTTMQEDGEYLVEIGLDAVICQSKKEVNALKVVSCIAEETLGNKKLVFLLVKGFDNYVTLMVDKDEDLFKSKNFYLLLNTRGLKFKEEIDD